MGVSLSKITSLPHSLQEVQREAAMRQQLAQIRQVKQQRDIMISSQIAATRDRLAFMGAFASVVVIATLLRSRVERKFSPLPLTNIPPVMFTFAALYQIDFAYGSKPDRINAMAKSIRENEDYWFNQPMELPITLKDVYSKMMAETQAMLAEEGNGRSTLKDWGF